MEGWIKLHRKVLESAIFMKPDYFQVWVYILLEVNHKNKKIIWNSEEKLIEQGAGIFSQKLISEKLKIPISRVNRILKCLENGNQIEIKSTNKYTEIKVVNYLEYQGYIENGNQTETKRKPNGNLTETNKNDKNDKKDIYTHPLQVFVSKLPNVSSLKKQMTVQECEELVSKYPKELIKAKLEAMENKSDLKKKYASVYLTLNNWCKKDSSVIVQDGGYKTYTAEQVKNLFE